MTNSLLTGWAEVDITPDNRVVELCGQYYQRVATDIHSRLKAIVLVLEQNNERSVMISMDVTGVPDTFCAKIQQAISDKFEEFKPERIIINATHTHNAPALIHFRNWWDAATDAINVDEFTALIEEQIINGISNALAKRKPTGIASAFEFAPVGHCRRVVYADNTAEMYGPTHCDTFTGLEGGEDAGVELLFFCDEQQKPLGMIVNIACPSQVMEATYKLSSDFMGALREKLKQEFGPEFITLPQIGAGGCQAPRDLTRNNSCIADLWGEKGVDVISDRLLQAIQRSWPEVQQALDYSPSMSHKYEIIDLPKRRASYLDYITAKENVKQLEAIKDSQTAYKEFCDTVQRNEKIPNRPGPYDDKNMHFVQIQNNEAVIRRYEEQDQQPDCAVHLHVLTLGNIVFATNPFELFLDFGQRIKARSKASQTFVIQLANGCDGYLPSPRAEELGGYGGLIINGKVGSDGGHKLVDKTVDVINQSF